MSRKERFNKAQRLIVAAAVAAPMRAQDDRVKSRRVALVDENGNVVGFTTLIEVQKALLKKHAIEVEVQPGQRPKEKPCDKCGIPVSLAKSGCLKSLCETCYFGRCARCGIVKKERRSKMCKSCAIRARSNFLPEIVPCAGCGKPLERRVDVKSEERQCLACYHRARAAKITRCRRGHDLVGDNLVLKKDGSRACRECKNTNTRLARARRHGPPRDRSDVSRDGWRARKRVKGAGAPAQPGGDRAPPRGTCATGPTRVVPARTLRQRVMEVLGEAGVGVPVRAGDVIRRMPGAKVESVHATFSKLAADGDVERVSFGVYRIPKPDGG